MDRREDIISLIEHSATPVSATKLAKHFGVSRQIIVGDIALLRAAGKEIIATPKGYVIPAEKNGYVKTIAVKHNMMEMEDELNTIVDEGGIVENVIVEHSVYGELRGNLDISSRYDVKKFLDDIIETQSAPLSTLTDGVHLHTILCADEAMYQRIIKALDEKGYLLK